MKILEIALATRCGSEEPLAHILEHPEMKEMGGGDRAGVDAASIGAAITFG